MTVTQLQEERAAAEASAWLARLQRDDVGEADGLEFEVWLAAAPANRTAYEQALSVWHDYDLAAEDVLAQMAPPARALRPPSRRGWLMAGGGAALAAGLAV